MTRSFFGYLQTFLLIIVLNFGAGSKRSKIAGHDRLDSLCPRTIFFPTDDPFNSFSRVVRSSLLLLLLLLFFFRSVSSVYVFLSIKGIVMMEDISFCERGKFRQQLLIHGLQLLHLLKGTREYRVAWKFCGSFILRIGDFLWFAGTNFCGSRWLKLLVGTNFCDSLFK